MIDDQDTNIDDDDSGTISKEEFLAYLNRSDIMDIAQANGMRNLSSNATLGWSFMWGRVQFFQWELEAYKRHLMVDSRTDYDKQA